jgi:hypothetical protein
MSPGRSSRPLLPAAPPRRSSPPKVRFSTPHLSLFENFRIRVRNIFLPKNVFYKPHDSFPLPLKVPNMNTAPLQKLVEQQLQNSFLIPKT